MNPAHLIVDYFHVQFAAPEGFSAHWSALAHTIPGSLAALSRHTRFHQSLFGVDWTDYATTSPLGQPLIQSRDRFIELKASYFWIFGYRT
jgi:hypothetical protein